MRSRFFIGCLSVVFFTYVLTLSVPAMAQEPIRGTQLALSGMNADDAETATDDELPKNPSPKVKELKKDNPPQSSHLDTKETKKDSSSQNQKLETKDLTTNNPSQSLEQEIKDLRQEVEKMRGENEARKMLEVPEEEKNKSVEDILSAVGNQYTLLKKGTLALQYGFSYAYYSGDIIAQSGGQYYVERRANHNLTNSITTEYALLNNLTLNAGIPFNYKYNLVGTASSQESTGLGDVSLGFQVQPFKAGGNIPSTIFSVSVSLPTGTSPYAVDPLHSLSTGSGLYSISGGVSVSKVLDPLVAFGNLSYSYTLPDNNISQSWGGSGTLTAVTPGASIGLAFGFGYALSYQASLNLSTSLSYGFNSKYTLNNTTTTETGSSLSASFNVGTGWRLTSKRSIYVTLGIGLTVNDPDFSLSFTLPFEF